MEKQVQPFKTKTKKKVDATTPIKPWAAIITWLILNLIWFSLSPMGTPHPVLSEKGGYREYYEMTVPDVMGASMPFEVICEVNVSDPDQGEVNISWINPTYASTVLNFDFTVKTTEASAGAYFLRVLQKDCEMAWTSPYYVDLLKE